MESAKAATLRRVYPLAQELIDLQAWKELLEDDIFCIQAGGRPLVTVSVMGNLGEYLAVAFYIGADARARFLRVHCDDSGEDRVFDMLQAHAIHVCAEKPALLSPGGRKQLVASGVPVSRKKLVPKLDVTRPGSMMNALSEEEAVLLHRVLPAAIPTLRRMKQGEILPMPEGPLLVLQESPEGGWRETWEEFSDEMFETKEPVAGPAAATGAMGWLGTERVTNKIEIGYFRMEAGIANASDGVDFIYLLLMMDVEADLILLSEVFPAAPDPRSIQKEIIGCVEGFFRSQNAVPARIFLNDEKLAEALGPFFSGAGVDCRRVKQVRGLDKALKLAAEFFEHRPGGGGAV